ncbi:hypothetical protein [Carboxylicivirga marina]|uniref:Peptidase M23 domain-containing protein n=1 Tax=Carboxylicivirga marina TaxID=2800988 RepID=A0ABS1HP67_9BACT|nr:hypothetical protein [Carboxylicivirga marina]MBK3519322.1 hypothetical protein [Carboxylicivirga marina]
MKRIYSLAILLCLICISTKLQAQYEKLDEYITFGSRHHNPIKVNGERNGDKITFFAENRSNYPYVVEIEFKILINLTPNIGQHKEVIYPGKHRIVTLSLKDAEGGFDYQYSTRYFLGIENKEADQIFPYLLPVSAGKKIEIYKFSQKTNRYYLNQFKLNKGDTICCMRKGYVVANTRNVNQSDRISNTPSVEVMHADGTVMIYENIDIMKPMVKTGSYIYPGQAIGFVSDALYVKVALCKFMGEGRISTVPFTYLRNDGQVISFDNSFINSEVIHPMDVVTKEMTKREKKKLKQGKLVL